MRGIIPAFLLMLVILSGCSSENKTQNPFSLSQYYQSGDINGCLEAIEQHPYPARLAIDSLLASYLYSITHGDTKWADSLWQQSFWIATCFSDATGQHDLLRKAELYGGWTQVQAIQKLELDSLYGEITQLKDTVACSTYCRRMEEIYREYDSLQDSFYLASVDFMLAKAYVSYENSHMAKYHFDRCKAICSNLGYFPLLADCEFHLARFYDLHQANYLKSAQCYLRAIEQYREIGKTAAVPYALAGLGHNYLQLYQTQRGIRTLQDAKNEYAGFNNDVGESYCLYAIAEAYLDDQMPDSALYYINQSIQLRKKIAPVRGMRVSKLGQSYSCLGYIYQLLDKYPMAYSHYMHAKSIFNAINDTAGLNLNNIRIAFLHLDRGGFERAELLFSSVIKNTDLLEEVNTCLYGMARCAFSNGDFDSAKALANQCVHNVEKTRKQLTVPDIKTAVLTDRIHYYHLLAVIYLEEYKRNHIQAYCDSAFWIHEQARAGTLHDMLLQENGPQCFDQGNKILDEITHLQQTMLREHPDKMPNIERRIRRLQDSLVTIKMGQSNSPESALVSGKISIPDIRKLQKHSLDSSSVILEYLLTDFGSYVFILADTDLRVNELPLTLDSLTILSSRYSEVLGNYPQDDKLSETELEIGRLLYRNLIPTDISRLLYKNQLIVVPSGALQSIPFECLIDQSDSYLLERFVISYIPSLMTFRFLRDHSQATPRQYSIVVFGDPIMANNSNEDPSIDTNMHANTTAVFGPLAVGSLPNSHNEIETITSLFGTSHTNAFSRENNAESTFKSYDFTKISHVHLTTHGLINRDEPSRSAILFSIGMDNKDDGLLLPYETQSLDMPVDLVFLSACATGTGKWLPGEGVLDLSRPFLIAGSHAVVVTMWPVDDMCAVDFVRDFYHCLLKGESPASALTSAKKQMLLSECRHPYFWAPYVVVGKGY